MRRKTKRSGWVFVLSALLALMCLGVVYDVLVGQQAEKEPWRYERFHVVVRSDGKESKSLHPQAVRFLRKQNFPVVEEEIPDRGTGMLTVEILFTRNTPDYFSGAVTLELRRWGEPHPSWTYGPIPIAPFERRDKFGFEKSAVYFVLDKFVREYIKQTGVVYGKG
jgi:hypothetical protein